MISIIVPIYNTSVYLDQCIKSLLKQDYSNLEIILVNDASTDSSLEICKKYASQDDRVIIINKDYNEGLELARHSGFSIAKGNFIMHIDSDDWLASTSILSKMRACIEATEADYVETGMVRCLDRFGIIKRKDDTDGKVTGLINQPELFDKYFISFFGINILSVNMSGKLYRKSFLDKLDIVPLGITMGEDLGYNIQLFPYLNKIYIMRDAGYNYRIGGMTSRFNKNLLPDLKRLHIYKMKLIEYYNYEKAMTSVRCELKNILKSEIQQRIQFFKNRDEICNFINDELKDPIYRSICDIEESSNFWCDPFVYALLKRDIKEMYEVCYKNVRQKRIKHLMEDIIKNIMLRL